MPPARRNSRTSERDVSMNGRTTMPARGWMPLRPRGPAPRSSRSRNVSAWSSFVCATAMAVAPRRAAARSKNAWRAVCAACSIEVPVSRASAATSMRSISIGISSLAARSRQNSASASASAPRSWWFRCAAPTTTKPSACGDLAQREQQRDRIGAARQRDGHTGTRAEAIRDCGWCGGRSR